MVLSLSVVPGNSTGLFQDRNTCSSDDRNFFNVMLAFKYRKDRQRDKFMVMIIQIILTNLINKC